MSIVTPEEAASASAEQLRRAFDQGFSVGHAEKRADAEPFVTLRVGSTAYALAVHEIAGFAAARKIVPLPSALPGLLGLTAVRGGLWPVYGLESLLGGEADEPPRWLILCRGADPVALGFARFEGHALLSRSARFAASEGQGLRAHVRELVRADDGVRGVIDVDSVVMAIQKRVGPSNETSGEQ